MDQKAIKKVSRFDFQNVSIDNGALEGLPRTRLTNDAVPEQERHGKKNIKISDWKSYDVKVTQ